MYRMSNEFRSNNGRGVNARKSVSLDFYEPVVVSGGAFVFLVIIDLINKNSELIPVHSVAGVVVTVLTLLLCRNNNMSAAWVMAALAAFFLLVTFWVALNQNQSVIDFKAWVGGSVRKFKKDIIWALTELDDSITDTYNSVSGSLAWLESKATGTVSSWNDQLTGLGNSVKQKYSDLTFNDDGWKKIYESEVKGGKSPAAALITANLAFGTPPLNTKSRTIANEINASMPIVTVGEFSYMCKNGTIHESVRKLCGLCSGDDTKADKRDECLARTENMPPPPLACLGTLSDKTTTPPTTAQRDACLDCVTKTYTDGDSKGKLLSNEDVEKCRNAVIVGKPWPPVNEVVSEFTNYSGSPAGTIGGSAAADPVAGTAAPFTNYAGGFRW